MPMQANKHDRKHKKKYKTSNSRREFMKKNG